MFFQKPFVVSERNMQYRSPPERQQPWERSLRSLPVPAMKKKCHLARPMDSVMDIKSFFKKQALPGRAVSSSSAAGAAEEITDDISGL